MTAKENEEQSFYEFFDEHAHVIGGEDMLILQLAFKAGYAYGAQFVIDAFQKRA